MNKPITIIRQEFIQSICGLCNSTDLPAFVKADVVEKVLKELIKASDQEYQRDAASYANTCQSVSNADKGGEKPCE